MACGGQRKEDPGACLPAAELVSPGPVKALPHNEGGEQVNKTHSINFWPSCLREVYMHGPTHAHETRESDTMYLFTTINKTLFLWSWGSYMLDKLSISELYPQPSVSLFFLMIESHCIALVGLELIEFNLPLPPSCWD